MSTICLRIYLISTLLTSMSIGSMAQSSVVPKEHKISDITQHMEYAIAAGGQEHYDRVPQVGLRLEPGHDTLLIRIHIKNQYDKRKIFYLFFQDPSLHYIELWDGLTTHYSGATIPGDRRSVNGSRYVFRLPFDPKEQRTLHFKIFSRNKITVTASIADSKEYLEMVTKERFYLGLFYGVITLVFFYSLFLLITTKLRMFAYYAGYILFVAMLCGGGDGITAEFLPGWIHWKDGFQDAIAAAISNIMGLMFMILFLRVKHWSVSYYRFLVGFLFFIGFSSLLLLVMDSLFVFDYLGLLGMVILAITLYTAYRAVRNDVPQSAYYLTAYLIFGLFILLFIANLFRLVDYSFWTQYAIHLGYGASLMVLSMGLGVRINTYYRQALKKEHAEQELIRRKNAELEELVLARTQFLNEKETNLRSIIDNSQDIIWLVDNEYRLIEFNTQFAQLWQVAYNKELEPGKSMLEQATTEQVKDLFNIRYDHALDGNIATYTDQYDVGDMTRTFEVRMFPILADEQVAGVAVFASDVTSRINNEQKLSEQYDLLSKVNQELDSFVYSASHDLKAPLASILGLINISRKAEKDELPQYFDMMETSIKRLDQFIKDIIDYSRNARTKLDYQEVDIQRVIDSCLEDLQYMHAQKNCDAQVYIQADAPLYLDATRLKVVLRNLLSNSIKYGCTDKARNKIDIRAEVSEEKLVLSVQDYGPGIPRQYHEDIFKMFFRAHDSTSGTGLGLYIVKQTLDKLHGHIELVSEVNRGTTFRVTVPNNYDEHKLPA